MKDEEPTGVEQGVQPRVWACVWPDSHGGGGFTTMDERAAAEYMRVALESYAAGNSTAVPTLVECWDADGVAAHMLAERDKLRAELTGCTRSG